jgi:hypothetical protein
VAGIIIGAAIVYGDQTSAPRFALTSWEGATVRMNLHTGALQLCHPEQTSNDRYPFICSDERGEKVAPR